MFESGQYHQFDRPGDGVPGAPRLVRDEAPPPAARTLLALMRQGLSERAIATRLRVSPARIRGLRNYYRI
ncbi:MAG: hypothetical protein ACFB22_09345 [Rhodothalassiaceae bacterium]